MSPGNLRSRASSLSSATSSSAIRGRIASRRETMRRCSSIGGRGIITELNTLPDISLNVVSLPIFFMSSRIARSAK